MAVPGLVFTLVAFILLVIASATPPTSNVSSFLDVGGDLHFGVFGYTGSPKTVGWHFPAAVADDYLNQDVFHDLTHALVLVPVCASLAGAAFLINLLGATCAGWVATAFASILSTIAFAILEIAFILEMVLFGLARSHLRERGVDATLGNANWIVLSAGLILGFSVTLGWLATCCQGVRREINRGDRW
ncbi:pali-domain-containing protein [Epithele typhae]|uniref:pali-domain-containing protein n=1 Tax=Epithele typhae TaxID=378194 RepID=UPI002007BC43|nr:pali-domain-containing protein [Epithele typhae]KAH9942283.1 pali-domain-containing protein [Epithele typhae]